MPLWNKTRHIARTIYGAEDIIADQKVRDQFAQYQAEGYGRYPICMAKTQYSFSTDPNLLGAPKGHVVPIREIRLAAGAEFVVVICGAIMTMPGLPRKPAAAGIRARGTSDSRRGRASCSTSPTSRSTAMRAGCSSRRRTTSSRTTSRAETRRWRR